MEISKTTNEWRNYQKGYVCEWLKDVKTAVSRLRSIQSQIVAEHEAYDMMKGISYDKESQRVERLHGDDTMVSHIIHKEENIKELHILDGVYSKKIHDARLVFLQLSSHELASEVMAAIYLEGKDQSEIAEMIGYSVKRIEQIVDMAKVECYWVMPVIWREKVIPAITRDN